MRCLALAGALADRGVACSFISAPEVGSLFGPINDRGFQCTLLSCSQEQGWEQDAAETLAAAGDSRPDWLIVDNYRLDHRWEVAIQHACERVMVIDDLANRSHRCDLLLDQNLGRTPADYRTLVPRNARLLTGPAFALLRPEFARLRESSLARRRNASLESIMISMGGTDPTNATSRLMSSLGNWPGSRQCRVVAVLGPLSPWIDDARALAAQLPYECSVLQDPPDYAGLMAESDLCIGTAGTSSWERCCLGVPSIVASVADNQVELAEQLLACGAALAKLDLDDLDRTLPDIMNQASLPSALRRASEVAATLCSGNGAGLVADEMLGGRP